MDKPLTYQLPLDRLTENSASFHSSQNHVGLMIPRKDWIDMGRPGEIKITPETVDPQGGF